MQEIALRRREQVAEGTFAFYFDKPASFSHQAGQNALLTLPDGSEGHTFTIASAPHERELMFATRMRDSVYKRVLAAASVGARFKLDGPAGVMVLHEDEKRPAVFLAGGIGITPFLAMARDAEARLLPHRLLLIYSNRRPQDAAFLAELKHMQNRNFRMVATMTDAADWKGEKRLISRELLAEHIKDVSEPVFYVAGPPAMTMAVQAMLNEMGINEDDMRSEEFYGY
jgi:ferredoxin-NADP reductase